MTALTRRRDSAAVPDERLTALVGDACNADYLARILSGHDAVIMAVGLSALVRALVPAMHGAGVRRVVMTSSRSVPATRPKLAITLAWLMFRAAYADLARAEGMLELSGLDWSVVRATMLTDRPYTGRVHTDFEANATGGDWRLTRADYAMTLLDVAEDAAMIGKAVGVGGATPGGRRALRAA